MKNLFQLFFIFCYLVLCNSLGDQTFAWGYDGIESPKFWPRYFPMCGGKTQSGIDIITSNTIHNNSICRPFKNTEWTMTKTKHKTFRIKYYPNSVSFAPISFNENSQTWEYFNQNYNAIAKFPNQFGRKKHIHEKFCFQSFHFHWGSLNEGGSEHNVDGLRYPLEMHFVHYSCDYKNITHALNDYNIYDSYVLGVVGILFKLGNKDNPAFEDILAAKKKLIADNEFIIYDLDVQSLLPKSFAFYGYEGSLTTPPCNPIVRWHVMKEPVLISSSQLKRLHNFSFNSKGLNIEKNYRPVQKNRNRVYACEKRTKYRSLNDYDYYSSAQEYPFLFTNFMTWLLLVLLVQL